MLFNNRLNDFLKVLPVYLRIEYALLMLVTVGVILSIFFILHLQAQRKILLQKHQEIFREIAETTRSIRKISMQQAKQDLLFQKYIVYRQNTQTITPQVIISAVTKAANQSGFMTKLIQPIAIQRQGDMQEVSWVIEATGGYKNFVNFLNVLSKESSLANLHITSFNIQKQSQAETVKNANSLVFKIFIGFYEDTGKALSYLNSIVKKNTLLDTKKIVLLNFNSREVVSDLKGCLSDPFANSSGDVNHCPSGLNFWPIKRLTLVGTLQQATKKMAVISDPNDDLYKVVIGSKIGREQKTLTDLDRGKAILDSRPWR